MTNPNNSRREEPMACVYGPPPPINRYEPIKPSASRTPAKIKRKSKLLIFFVSALAGAAIAGLLIWLL